ncbi:hypothetical protein Tco_1504377 [Tanacetum coccineum]
MWNQKLSKGTIFPASPGNTPSNSSEDLTKYLLSSLAISPFHDDLYIKVMQPYDATNNELPIPPPRAPIAPPTIFPPSPMFDPQDFFLPEEILPPQKRARFLSSSSDFSTPPQIEGLGNGRVIIQRDFDQLVTELQEARTHISKFQREQIRHDDEIVLARVKTSTLEILIEDIQNLHQNENPYNDMSNKFNITKMAPKRTSTSAAPAMSQAAIRKPVADSVSAALEAQAATMANADNTKKS